MCRLFGLHAGAAAVSATFWLLDAPGSLAMQSHQNPDGAGIGVFDTNKVARVDKQPIAAWDDCEFAAAARELTGTTFVAHVRHASTGAHTTANTHPFEQDGRLFAHNGVVQGLDVLDARLAEVGSSDLVRGETDSERVFALITGEIGRHSGDVAAGLRAAVGWVIDSVPVYSLNLRTDRIHARSVGLAEQPSVVVASEPMDDDAQWRLLESGELVHVDADLTIGRTIPFPDPPRHPLNLSDLGAIAARSQKSIP